ncbi:8-oxoguanine deaminase (plasmid) [Rhizobium leguminosarum]
MKGRLWIQSPLAIMAEGAGGGIVVENGRIVELVTAGRQPADSVDARFDAGRHVVIPGLVNAHHHMFQTLTRAHPAAINKSLWPWIRALYPIWAKHMTPEAFRLAVRLALTELLLSGCTTTSDHHYLYAAGLEDAMDVEAEEAARLGMRITLTRGSLDIKDQQGVISPANVVQDEDVILADSERVLRRYHDRFEGAMVQVALAPCAPFDVTLELMRETAALAERYDCRLHTHLVETKTEAEYCRSKFACTPVEYLDRCNWLNARTWLAHGIHFDDAEIAELGRHGVGICHCPTSNMVLASGMCRTCELEAAGAPVGLGVDGSASNDNSNLMESVRHALMLNRLSYGAEAVTHIDALRWGTAGSAKLLGRDDIGSITLGRQADLAFYRLDELRFSGAGDPLAALVLCGATTADRVMIAGEWRVADGMPAGVDIEALIADHNRVARNFLLSV